jgi:hypothetical protein
MSDIEEQNKGARQGLTHTAGLPRSQPVSGLGGAEAGVIRAKDGQALLRRSRLRISYSCTIA